MDANTIPPGNMLLGASIAILLVAYIYHQTRRRRFKCLVIGVDFIGTELELAGSRSDQQRVRAFLKHRCGLRVDDPSECRFLNDFSNPPPTDTVMRDSFAWLTSDMQPGDVRMFHYSGHGLIVDPETMPQIRRGPRNETDECIAPSNLLKGGDVITDEELHERLVRPFRNSGARPILWFDCCYMGNPARLMHIYEVQVHPVTGKMSVVHRLNDDFPDLQRQLAQTSAEVDMVTISASDATEQASEIKSDKPDYRPFPTKKAPNRRIMASAHDYGALTDAVYDRFEEDLPVTKKNVAVDLPSTTWRELLLSTQQQFIREGLTTQHVQICSSKPLHLDHRVFDVVDPRAVFP